MSEEENWGDYVEDSEDEKDVQSEGEIELENIFYSAEELKESDYQGAIEQYFLLLDSEEPASEKAWSAKAINEILGLKVKKNDLADLHLVIKRLLAYINNMSKYDRGITIDYIFAAVNKVADVGKKRETFETLLSFLKEKDMQMIWIGTCVKLARLYLTSNDYVKFDEIISQLERASEFANFEEVKDNIKTLNMYAEIISMKIEKYLTVQDLTYLKKLVDHSNRIKLADICSSDLKILSVLKEAEGTIAVLEKNWKEAETAFKKAFQYYHDVGSAKTKNMILLNTVFNILSGMEINPFSSPEAEMFLKDETVVPFRDLWVAYFEKNHKEYIGLLETQCKGEFMKTMDLQSELRKAILHGFLKKIVVSYKTLSFSYLARELRISKESICHILLDMISEKKINGLIDEVEELYINQDSEGDKERGDQLRLLNKAVNYVLEVHQANMQ